MTNESISGFLNSIAEAKRAFDAEPDYQRQIRDLENDKKRLGDTVAHRELRIHELKQVEETLTQKLRSVEAERDDAGFRALEEADKVQNLLTVVRGFIGDALKVCSAVTGEEQVIISKESLTDINKVNSEQSRAIDTQAFRITELEAELNALRDQFHTVQEQFNRPLASQGAAAPPSFNVEGTDPWSPKNWPEDKHPEATLQGQSETIPTASASDPIPQGLGNESVKDPIVATTQTAPSASAPSAVSQDTAPTTTSASAEGQSEGPFAATDPTQSTSASSHSAMTTDGAPSNASPPERNRDRSTFFKGRKYFDITYFVPLHQWLNEGGSREDYYWRPAEANVPLPEASQASHRS